MNKRKRKGKNSLSERERHYTPESSEDKLFKYNFSFGLLDNLEHELPEITGISDRFQHTYLVGKTGMGKSSLMERMAMYDINKGLSVIFIDPKGDSTKKIYSLIENKEKVTYISIECPTVINPLDHKTHHVDEVISEFVQILDVLITLTASNPESTVLMREIIGMAIRAIEKQENKNIDYLVRFLMYEDERKKVVNTIKKDSVRKYWIEFDSREHNRIPKNKDKQESAKRVASRLVEISEGRMKDFVVGKNEFDITEIVSNGKIVLVDTSKMSMNSRIYLSNLIVYSVLSYCEFSDSALKPLLVYVDEFQIVVSQWFSDLLARSRSKQVGFTLAHQSFAQISPKILSVILDTVHTMVCFRTGDEVAQRLSSFYNVKPSALFNLTKYYAWVRIGTDNTLVECYPPLKSDKPSSEIIISKQTVSEETKQIFNFLGEAWMDA